MKIVLASLSPRRKELLSKLSGIEIEVRPSNIDESGIDAVSSALLTMTLAKNKASAVYKEGEIVLGADTVVEFEGKILGKPKGRNDAMDMLLSLSGKTHEIITGVCIYSSDRVICGYDKSTLEFNSFSAGDIEEYISLGKPLDKAGGYGIQDKEIERLIKRVDGSITNIIGLPMELIEKYLGEYF